MTTTKWFARSPQSLCAYRKARTERWTGLRQAFNQKLVDSLWRAGDERKTVVFVTHDIDEAILLADRVAFMRHGRILADRAVDVPRTRSSSIFLKDERARRLKEELTELFYLDGDDEDAAAERALGDGRNGGADPLSGLSRFGALGDANGGLR